MRPISTTTKEYWLEMSAGAEAKNDVLEARADRIDGITDYDFNGDVAYFEASPSGINDLVYSQIQTEHGEQPVRTLFGKQYTEADEFEEINQELEQHVEVAADGGTTEEDYKPQTMADVDHTHPNQDNRQRWFSRGLID